MKRLFSCMLLLALLLSWGAQASLDYNSFFDDRYNAGRFASFAKAEEYVYWLYLPDDGLFWLETPNNLYRMKPGDGEAELLLQSGDEAFLIGDMVCIGDKLLLSVTDENYENWYPALVNLDGSGYRQLPGNIGSVVVCGGTIYNSVDGAIYEINADTLQPKRVYSYPTAIAGDNPILTQCEGMNLYFTTDSHDWYRLDLQFMELKKIDRIRGDGFARNYKFYVSDYDNGGTYRYDLGTGARRKISENTYSFQRGSGDYIQAFKKEAVAGMDEEYMRLSDFDYSDSGCIFDTSSLDEKLENALIGTCAPSCRYLLDGVLYDFDWQNNRVDFSTEPVAALIQK